MSGGSIAYHLRENKAIERNLFIDLLSRVGRKHNISDYSYVGFGGPFLEDFKAIHAALRINKMTSIEMDENVQQRQRFNLPAKFISTECCTSGEFINQREFPDPTIVWLEFTTPRETYQQLSEFRALAGKLGNGDVLKITLNANPQGLGGNAKGPELLEQRSEELSRRLGDFTPFQITADHVTQSEYAETLVAAVRKSISGLSGRVGNEYFQPLAIFTYKDSGHVMLTVTGIILSANEEIRESFFSASRFKFWPFSNLDWNAPIEISVPALSAKERMTLDAYLPVDFLAENQTSGEFLSSALGFFPGESKDQATAQRLLENYARFYRAYPMFSRVVI